MSAADEYSRLILAGVNASTAIVIVQERDRRHRDRWLRQRREAPLKPREHGSERGYRQHQAYDERSCAPCRDAHALYNDEHCRRTTA